jgi:hypothetical protein
VSENEPKPSIISGKKERKKESWILSEEEGRQCVTVVIFIWEIPVPRHHLDLHAFAHQVSKCVCVLHAGVCVDGWVGGCASI